MKINIPKRVEGSVKKKARQSHRPSGLHQPIHQPSSWKASSLVAQLLNPTWTCWKMKEKKPKNMSFVTNSCCQKGNFLIILGGNLT